MLKYLFFIFCVMSSLSNLTFANSISGSELKKIVNKWLLERGSVANVNLLEEIKYPKCDERKFFINDISGKFNLIKILCVSPHQWSIITRNKLEEKKPRNNSNEKKGSLVFALNKPKKKGEIINADDVIKIHKKIFNINGLVFNKEDLIGKKLSKSVSANRAIFFSSLERDWLIEKNSLIFIENRINSVTIKVEGIALQNGDLGEKIRVKNVKSGKILQGFVRDKKKVSLNTKQF
ncbi:MAG: flagella basal body P-ring formation protein FlgA [Rickettsiales bacterium]|nr:flagella basal body P-ring formation protein FlgA [Rickettsiales bacterium]